MIIAKATAEGETLSSQTSRTYDLYWWQQVGEGIGNGMVNAIAYDASDDSLYAGGTFTGNVATFGWTSWQSMSGLGATVDALACDGAGRIYAGVTADWGISYWYKYVSPSWDIIDVETNHPVRAIVCSTLEHIAYVGGEFNNEIGNYIASTEGTHWAMLDANSYDLNGTVEALLYLSDSGCIVAGGQFTDVFAGGAPNHYIAYFNKDTPLLGWRELPDYNGLPGYVSHLAYDPVNHIVFAASVGHGIWQIDMDALPSTSWTQIYAESHEINCLAYNASTNRLYASVEDLDLFCYSNGAWSSVSSGNSAPRALLIANDEHGMPVLYAGGSFTEIGNKAINRIAKYGKIWRP
jgi:hypothetical protein